MSGRFSNAPFSTWRLVKALAFSLLTGCVSAAIILAVLSVFC